MSPDTDLSGIRCRVETVTPEMARRWLDTLRHQRTPPPPLLHAYTCDMTAGVWKLNAAPLIFSGDGTLLDGRIRLMACLAARRPFPSLIVEGIDAGCVLSIDEVRSRSLATVLAIRHERDGLALSAILRLLFQYSFNAVDDYSRRPSIQQLLHMLEARPELRRDAAVARSVHGPLMPAVAGVLHHLGCRVDAAVTERFFTGFNDDGLVDPSRPAVLLRRTVAALNRTVRAQSRTWMLAVAINAWNAARAGVPLSRLGWRQHDSRETLPRIDCLPDDDGADLIGITSLAGPAIIGGDDLRVSVEIVTPDAARRLLANNPHNRAVQQATVDRYRRDMAAGHWWLNGQTLKIGRGGRLLDGQHRCRAAVESGVAFPAIVVHNVDDGVFDTFDIGYRRGFDQILRGLGEVNACALAGGLRRLHQRSRGEPRSSPSHAELLALYHRHPEIRRHASRIANLLRHLIEPSASIALHFAFRLEDTAKAEAFVQSLADGAALDKASPILLLRNRLLESRQSAADRLSIVQRMALTIKAWRAFVAGQPMRQLRWLEGGEAFPSLRWLPDD